MVGKKRKVGRSKTRWEDKIIISYGRIVWGRDTRIRGCWWRVTEAYAQGWIHLLQNNLIIIILCKIWNKGCITTTATLLVRYNHKFISEQVIINRWFIRCFQFIELGPLQYSYVFWCLCDIAGVFSIPCLPIRIQINTRFLMMCMKVTLMKELIWILRVQVGTRSEI